MKSKKGLILRSVLFYAFSANKAINNRSVLRVCVCSGVAVSYERFAYKRFVYACRLAQMMLIFCLCAKFTTRSFLASGKTDMIFESLSRLFIQKHSCITSNFFEWWTNANLIYYMLVNSDKRSRPHSPLMCTIQASVASILFSSVTNRSDVAWRAD